MLIARHNGVGLLRIQFIGAMYIEARMEPRDVKNGVFGS